MASDSLRRNHEVRHVWTIDPEPCTAHPRPPRGTYVRSQARIDAQECPKVPRSASKCQKAPEGGKVYPKGYGSDQG